MSEDLTQYLTPGPAVQSDAPQVIEFAEKAVGDATDPKEKAIRLYYAVRDQIRYDPYSSAVTIEELKATRTLELGRGWCVPKAILLAACCRAQGIPARMGYADVRNHMSTAKLREQLKTDIFYWHSYTSTFLNGKWVKSTPAFNVELCDKFGLKTLEFNGEDDSLYHPIDKAGNRHMEYLNDRGEYAEPPVEEILRTFVENYPGWYGTEGPAKGDFDAEVDAETKSVT